MRADAAAASGAMTEAGGQPRVSIALAMHNAEHTIAAALRSVLAQQYERWELLVIDDGSDDASVRIARAIDDPRVRLHVDHARRGLAARLNQAIDLARGEYLARMDADDIAYPERIARQLAFLDANPAVDLVGAAMMVFRSRGEPVGLHPIGISHEAICARPFDGFYLPHPTWMGRIAFFRRWRYDERYRKSQDQDLLRRAYRASRFAGLPEALVGYRQDRISLAKVWESRMNTVRSSLAAAWREGRPGAGAVGASRQIAKALFDTLAITAGLERALLARRSTPFTHEDARRWSEVWSGLHEGAG